MNAITDKILDDAKPSEATLTEREIFKLSGVLAFITYIGDKSASDRLLPQVPRGK